jgi:hypothetical protein
VTHPERTVVDTRLLSQVELNVIRSRAHANLLSCWTFTDADVEEELGSILRDSSIELDLWLQEWQDIIYRQHEEYPTRREASIAILNLKIQHAWALITLHLKAVSNTGIDNIAVMTDFQRSIVCTAKEVAIQHLHLLLKATSTPSTPTQGSPVQDEEAEHQAEVRSAYLSSFKRAMDFVWAKCAFSILLVLRLSLGTRDPPQRLMELLRKCNEVLEELKSISSGHIAYFHILQVSVEKCERALQEWMVQQASQGIDAAATLATPDGSNAAEQRTAESDFEGYVPREFLFEWNFPGLNIKHVPLGWQDLFVDFDYNF